MIDLRKLAVAAVFGTALSAFAQAPAPNPSEWATRMDQQMTAMRSLHEQMTNAKTQEERNALMATHGTVMQHGMQMMRGTGPGLGPHGMAGMGAGMAPKGAGPGAAHGSAGAPAEWATNQHWMEARMEMMQAMMPSTRTSAGA